jgi:serine/threonine-protein kinase HipA
MIHVIKSNKLLGILKQDENIISFEYNNDIKKENYLTSLPYIINESKILFPVFQNMLPENDQLELLKHELNIKNEIDILLHLDNPHGSFEFYNDEDFKFFIPQEWETFKFEDRKVEILDNNYSFPNILHGYNINIPKSILFPKQLANSKVIGLSGYQYKFSVKIDTDKKEVYRDSNSYYFIKPFNQFYTTYNPNDKNRSYIPYLLINEHLFMTLARDFGFDIPYNCIIKDEYDYHYIIKRFDRYKNSKIDHYELLTIMGKTNDYKYKVTMQEVLKTAKDNVNEEEFLKLFKFLIFSIIIGHGDLHAKNLSLINKSNNEDEIKKIISPFYDISTTKIYKDTKKNDIGLKVLKKTSNIKRSDILELAEMMQIDKDIASIYIGEVSKKFVYTFLDYISKLPNEIKSLPYHEGRYGNFKPFENILKKYYEDRFKYINENLFTSPLLKKEESSIWE